MTAPHIQHRYHTVPESLMARTVGADLRTIRDEDGATNADLAAGLGKSAASIERYLAGTTTMPFPAFIRGCRQWDGRFANGVMALVGLKVEPIAPIDGTDHQALAGMCDLSARLARALQDGVVEAHELEEMWPAIERVSGQIDRLRALRVHYHRHRLAYDTS